MNFSQSGWGSDQAVFRFLRVDMGGNYNEKKKLFKKCRGGRLYCRSLHER